MDAVGAARLGVRTLEHCTAFPTPRYRPAALSRLLPLLQRVRPLPLAADLWRQADTARSLESHRHADCSRCYLGSDICRVRGESRSRARAHAPVVRRVRDAAAHGVLRANRTHGPITCLDYGMRSLWRDNHANWMHWFANSRRAAGTSRSDRTRASSSSLWLRDDSRDGAASGSRLPCSRGDSQATPMAQSARPHQHRRDSARFVADLAIVDGNRSKPKVFSVPVWTSSRTARSSTVGGVKYTISGHRVRRDAAARRCPENCGRCKRMALHQGGHE